MYQLYFLFQNDSWAWESFFQFLLFFNKTHKLESFWFLNYLLIFFKKTLSSLGVSFLFFSTTIWTSGFFFFNETLSFPVLVYLFIYFFNKNFLFNDSATHQITNKSKRPKYPSQIHFPPFTSSSSLTAKQPKSLLVSTFTESKQNNGPFISNSLHHIKAIKELCIIICQ